MKKKISFISISILLIILNTYAIINAKKILETSLEIINNLPFKLDDSIINIYSNTKLITIPAIICIISNIIAILIVSLNKYSEKRNQLLIMYALNIILSNYNTCSILAIIAVIICATIKSTKKTKTKKEIPIIERIDKDNKSILFAVLALTIYFSQFLLNFININSNIIAFIIGILIDLVIILFCIFAFKNNLKRDIKYLKDYFKNYLSFIGHTIGIMYIIYFILCITSTFICHSTSVNQEMLNQMPLWYLIPAAIIYAPIVEEIIFRGCLRRIIKNDKLFIILSGIIFGLLHMIHEINLLNACILSLPYILLGSTFAYIYVKTNNITTNILCHWFHNSVVIILQILLLY